MIETSSDIRQQASERFVSFVHAIERNAHWLSESNRSVVLTPDQQIIQNKTGLSNLARTSRNVSHACELFGYA